MITLPAVMIDCLVFYAAFNNFTVVISRHFLGKLPVHWSIYPDTNQSVIMLTP